MIKPSTIFTGDNLPILRGMDSASVDLIYLDPPFNSNRHYSAPIGSKAAGAEFKDTWTLEDTDDAWWGELADAHPALYRVIDAAGASGGKGDKAYCIYMAVRLLEMHRVLKSTGSLYLHCDPTMSHALKLLLDAIFGARNFINEITWKRYAVHSLATTGFDTVSDILLFFSKNKKEISFTNVFSSRDNAEMKKQFPLVEPETKRRFQHVALEQSSNQSSAFETRIIQGKRVVSDLGWRWTQQTFDKRLAKNPHLIYWTRTGRPRYKLYADQYKGKPVGNIWTDIAYLSTGNAERLGYPTQKPLKLLQRIVQASSNKGDVVLDPFCGCATACLAAESLQRQWIGIDISPKAFELINVRLKKELGGIFSQVIHRTDIPARIGGKRSKDIKHILFGKQEGLCNGCRSAFEFRNFEIDHIVPKDAGGADDDHNLQLLCGWCNRKKGKRSMEYLKAELIRDGILSK